MPEGEVRPLNPYVIFSFQDSSCIAFNMFNSYLPFSIDKDKLHFYAYNKNFDKEKRLTLKIISLNDSLLKVSIGNPATKYAFIRDMREENYRDTIVFQKIRKKNDVTPSLISFYSSGCFGTCPSFALEIETSGRFKYFGDAYTEKVGGYKGQISEPDYKRLLNLVHCLPLNSMKDHYAANGTDNQTLSLSLYSQGKWKDVYVYSHSDEPVELRMLLDYLFQFGRYIEAQPDRTVNITDLRAADKGRLPEEKAVKFLPPLPE